ncbi:MAG TPA: ABC transporter substrate-binding protein [Cyclobacteriaceae bacterium]|nr:ABC transporter substrate-binding protein [Cyclobacteriaceae bacterium]
MKISLLSILLAVFATFPLTAQEALSGYRQAKQMIANGNYGQAMDLLSPYLDVDTYGEVANYASYHYARAAYQSRRYDLATNALKQLIRTRSWKHKDEASYLLALSHFQQQNISEALSEIKGIQQEQILEEAYRASYDFLQHISTSVLIVNLPNYESNKGLVMALRKQFESRSILSAGEQEVYDRIKNIDFGPIAEKSDSEKELNQTLEVAVVLPFNYTGGSGVRRLDDNNFVFELYQGINFAAVEAKKRGVSLIVRTFDTERKTGVVQKILEDPFFHVADVIVGPIYPEEADIVANFAERQKIPFINPLSNIAYEEKSHEYSYLFRPSIQSLSEGILEYSKRLPGKRIAIAYSSTSRDEMLARQYSELAQKMGYQIVDNRKVAGRDMRSFFENLSVGAGRSSRVDQIVIFSDDPNIASPTFAVMESLTTEIPVLVLDSWLYFNFASYEMLDIQNFHFIGNNTVSVTKDEVNDFREKFFETYNVYPGLNAHLGYEIIHWITNVVNSDKGFDFKKNLDQAAFQDGKLTFGFDFKNSNSNNFVPILKLSNGALEVE